MLILPTTSSYQETVTKREKAWSSLGIGHLARIVMLLASCIVFLAGCGPGGYPGAPAIRLSASSAKLDAGEQMPVSANVDGNVSVIWKLSCSAASCGTISSTMGAAITYTAPVGVILPISVTLTAAVDSMPSVQTVNITVNPDPAISGTTHSGVVGVPYTTTFMAAGGTAPLTWSASGSLPPGLTFNSTTGVIAGTPTAVGTYPFALKVTDSSSVPDTVTAPETIVVTAAPLLLTMIAGSPAAGTVGVAYSSALSASGGTMPYIWSVSAGALPPGLSLSPITGIISGTPTAQGTYPFTASVTDANGTTASAPFSITVTTLTLSNPPNGKVGTPYSGVIGVTGGTAPYTCVVTSGGLPPGLSLAGCTISGTPTVAGTIVFGVKATDASNPSKTTTGPVSLTISPTSPALTITSPPGNATVGTPYSAPIGVAGGTGPYTCTVTGGALPAGLTLTGCVISGTPTVAGPGTATIMATDSSSPTNSTSQPITVTVAAASVAPVISSPPNATVGTAYTQTIPVSGGSAPYTCTLTGGALPTGLMLQGCIISGTPTLAGPVNLTIKATDSATPAASTTGPVSFTVLPVSPVSLTGSLPNAILGQPYAQTLHATGGVGPYTYTRTAGALPPGITLSTTGVISGTPTAAGASSFTVQATDSEATPQTATLPLILLVTYAPTSNDAQLIGPYAFLFQGYDDAVVGVLAYRTATVGSFTADGMGSVSAGELDSNHQVSTAAGNTISSNGFLGTYTVGTDNRGRLTITVLNADGTAKSTSTYSIVVKPPVAPSTISAQGQLIEFDNDTVQGTKGSGMFFAQQPSAFAAGLNGSYAFGMQGDTPCLPACSVGILAGPTASVGQFATDGAGNLISGTSDSNIASTNFANEPLSGTYGSADGNGRLQLTMNTAGTPVGIYPTDYAVYVVSANQALVLSTDKHSVYLLLAGSAQLQTQSAFSNASLTGPFIGYENSPTNPGLVGSTVQSTANLSTSTIFRDTADAAGACAVTNVDIGGTTGVANGLTGLGSGTSSINAVFGTYQSTGGAVCTVATNGRGVLNYPVPSPALQAVLAGLGLATAPPPARIVYLSSPDRGYFLESGYAGLGRIEPQTGAPFSLATFKGNFIFGTFAAGSAASIDASGTVTADGAGNATSVEDENIGVGTVNVLRPNVSTVSTYTTPDATTGRFNLNGNIINNFTVIYSISPGRFVLLDTNPATTSPAFSLLY